MTRIGDAPRFTARELAQTPRRPLRGLLAASMCLLVLGGSAVAFDDAREAGPGPGPGRDGNGGAPDELIERHAEELGLDDETRAAIREVVESSRERGEELRFELQEAHRRLRFMLDRNEPDEAAVMQQAEKIGQIRIEESKHRLAVLLRVRGMLTPEQRDRLKGLARERGAGSGIRDQIVELREACAADAARLCPEVAPGRDRLACMRDHRDELSPECAEASASARRAFEERRRHWSPRNRQGEPRRP